MAYIGNSLLLQLNWSTATSLYTGTSDFVTIIDENNLDSYVRDKVLPRTITDKVLTNLPTLSNASISATDSMLQAFAKLQGQINNKANTSSLPAAATVAPLVEGTATVGTSTKYAREDHRHPARTLTSSDIPNLDASKITSGTISIERLPKGALERLFIVASQSAAVSLVTSGEAQDGDTVQITGENNTMYFVVDATATTFTNIFKVYTAGSATSVPWSGVTSKPSTFTPTLGTSSTTAYAGDKGTLNKNILDSLQLKQVSAIDNPLVLEAAIDLQFYINQRENVNSTFSNAVLSHMRIPAATTTTAGLMTKSDKSNLNTAYG